MSESSLETTGSAQRNQRLALVAVGGVAVIGVIVYLLLFSGGSSSKTPTAANAPVASAASSPVASASPSTAQAVPAAFTAAVGRDPFQPALTPPPPPAVAVAPAAGAAKASASPTPTPTPTVSVIVIPTLTLAPTGSPSPTPTVTVTATPSPTGLPTTATPLTLKVVRVDGSGTADVTVTSGTTTTPYSGVLPGQVFGTYFKLVSIVSSDPAAPPVTYGADFQYGDQFVQLAQGQSAQLG